MCVFAQLVYTGVRTALLSLLVFSLFPVGSDIVCLFDVSRDYLDGSATVNVISRQLSMNVYLPKQRNRAQCVIQCMHTTLTDSCYQ